MSYIDWRDAGTSAFGSLSSHSRPDYTSGTSASPERTQPEIPPGQSKDISARLMSSVQHSLCRARRLSFDGDITPDATLSGGDQWHRNSEDFKQSTSAFHSQPGEHCLPTPQKHPALTQVPGRRPGRLSMSCAA